MTSAELKTLREACGLSQRHLSDMAAVNERTVRYWESGKSTVPEDVEALVAQLDETLETAALAALTQARTLAQTHGAPEVITLFRYADDAALWAQRPDMKGLPATCHAALLARARRLMLANGLAVEIQWA